MQAERPAAVHRRIDGHGGLHGQACPDGKRGPAEGNYARGHGGPAVSEYLAHDLCPKWR
ncbi:hypothetical protein L532_3129 [Bordetella bronchiseptica OSU095]|nr:hypothetical protein L542_3092 [Bordetella bronchiseptica F-1]KDD47107.1 hypothetical protein L532_3129 [Bordetella bronchiseptica OSU095]